MKRGLRKKGRVLCNPSVDMPPDFVMVLEYFSEAKL